MGPILARSEPSLPTLNEPSNNPNDPAEGVDSAAPASASAETTTVQISDGPQASGSSDGPYQNLWVPLIVVPAGIVMALVGIFALFGAISTDERSLSENLSLVRHGGANERDQALFSLMRQAAENNAALGEDREPPYAVAPEFAADVSNAVEELEPEEHTVRLALAVLLGTMEDARGGQLLTDFLVLGDEADADAKLRIAAIQNLALLAGHNRDLVDTDAVFAGAEPLLQHPDRGLRGIAVSLMGSLTLEEARAALLAAMGDAELSVRASAALALARLTPPEPLAIGVLVELVGTEPYTSANSADRTRFRRAEEVSIYRQWAVAALGSYSEAEAQDVLKALLEDADLRVREAAMLALGEE
ncbi:MAG: HEAT repeat protein [Planctomycetota bacterium]